MTLPILLIFYVSKWKNNKKHWKIGIGRHCDVIIGRGNSKLGVGLLCTEMIIVCKFHDPSIIGSRDTEGGPRSPAPVTDWPKKSSLNRIKMCWFNKFKQQMQKNIRNVAQKFLCKWIIQLKYVYRFKSYRWNREKKHPYHFSSKREAKKVTTEFHTRLRVQGNPHFKQFTGDR